jgi:hypothetical protein
MPIYEYAYGGEGYWTGASIRYQLNQSESFGIYVHLGAHGFNAVNGQELDRNTAMGFISTAVAIWSDVGYAAQMLFCEYFESCAAGAIYWAKRQGRTHGLEEAEKLVKQGIEAYNQSNYKLAALYGLKAVKAAENATTPPNPTTVILILTPLTILTVGTTYWALTKRRKNNQCATKE